MMRMALSEAEKSARIQRAILPVAESYERPHPPPQWCPRGGPSLSRLPTVGAQLRRSEYQQASMCMHTPADPVCLRGFEIASSARDAMSPHQDRGFGDLDSPLSVIFKEPIMSLDVLELNQKENRPMSRAMFISDSRDFSLDKVTVIGVWGSHTRFLFPSAEQSLPLGKPDRRRLTRRCAKDGAAGRCQLPIMLLAYISLWGRVPRAPAISVFRRTNQLDTLALQRTGGGDGPHVPKQQIRPPCATDLHGRLFALRQRMAFPTLGGGNFPGRMPPR